MLIDIYTKLHSSARMNCMLEKLKSITDIDWLYVLCLIGFSAYGVYYLYNAAKMMIGNEKARRQFLDEHKNEQIKREDSYLVWVIVEAAAIAYCIYSVFTISPEMEQAEWFRLAFAMVRVILAGQIVLNIVKRRILIGEKGFVYENDYVPFQTIVNMEPKRMIVFTIVEVLCLKNRKYSMPGKCGQLLHDAYLEYKKAKKAGKKKN